LESDNGGGTESTHSSQFEKGYSLMGEFFMQYLLKKYSYVLSDSQLSPLGFQFYYKNYDRFVKRGFRVFVVDQERDFKRLIHNKNELQKYYGDNEWERYNKLRYMISR
jgi:hypothetical protein